MLFEPLTLPQPRPGYCAHRRRPLCPPQPHQEETRQPEIAILRVNARKCGCVRVVLGAGAPGDVKGQRLLGRCSLHIAALEVVRFGSDRP